MVADTLDEVIAGRPASFSWRAMLNGRPPTPSERRRFIEIRPVLDYAALMPGKAATDAIRKAATDLDIAAQYGATLAAHRTGRRSPTRNTPPCRRAHSSIPPARSWSC